MQENKHAFWKISPSGNTTVFLDAEDFSPSEYAAAASRVMDAMHLGAEQVGYISLADRTLRMMGGEFCVNATRAFAALLARTQWERTGQKKNFTGQVTVSGADSPIKVRVTPELDAEAALTFPALPRVTEEDGGIRIADLPGIRHLIVTGARPCDPAIQSKRLIEAYARPEDDAVGCMWLDGQSMRMTPYVWVRKTDSLCPETACGSGTLACALFLRQERGDGSFALMQPSGEALTVRFERSEGSSIAAVGGKVRFIAEGTLYL